MTYIFIILFSCVAPLFGQDPELPPSLVKELESIENVGDSRFFSEFLNMLFTLGVVLLGLYILTWIVKRLNKTGLNSSSGSQNINVIDYKALSQRSTIYVVDVYGKRHTIVETLNGITELRGDTETH